jgi:DNA-binding MarR family transcriptional regulator
MAPKPEMSYSEIAEELGLTVSTVHMCLSRGLKKLRRKGLIFTARELAAELEAHRSASHSLSRPRSAKKCGAQ